VFFQAEVGIRDFHVTGVQTCALPISPLLPPADWSQTACGVVSARRTFTHGRLACGPAKAGTFFCSHSPVQLSRAAFATRCHVLVGTRAGPDSYSCNSPLARRALKRAIASAPAMVQHMVRFFIRAASTRFTHASMAPRPLRALLAGNWFLSASR